MRHARKPAGGRRRAAATGSRKAPVEERVTQIAGQGIASEHAAALLARLALPVERVDGPADPSPAALWARSGAMALTGHEDGPPLAAPGPLAACAEGALRALRALAPEAPLPRDGAALLGEHAACFGYRRRGRVSPGGTCRLLRCADGWIALNLARPDDLAAVPAWLQCGALPHEPACLWREVGRRVERRGQRELIERARLLSLPLATAVPPPDRAPDWLREDTIGAARDPGTRPPLVVDLSSLWAGPLCTSLLRDAGARVLKLESTGRPDGARAGSARFFDLMNGGKASVALDLLGEAGRSALCALVERADVVVESARPRALRQLGIHAEAFLAERPGRTWVSITGYGRRDPAPGRVAFGDDAAVAAGLASATGALAGEDGPLFCGDAIADPLTGLHAAVAAFASWRSGGGRLLDLSLCDVAGHALAAGPPDRSPAPPVLGPRARPATSHARPLGADTHAVLRELGIRC